MTNDIKKLIDDLFIIGMSIAFAVLLVKTNLLQFTLTSTREFEIIGSFIAGMFFTSLFTTAPAMVTLGELAAMHSPWVVAGIGALGAASIDTIIFLFFKDRLADHMEQFRKKREKKEKIKHLFHVHFKWLPFIVGGLIIASPLPDELAIGLMGFSKMDLKPFIVASYVFNFIGILIIGLIARALV